MSFYDRLKGQNLLGRPTRWTSRHVRFLCSFDDPRPAPDTNDSNHQGEGSDTDRVERLLENTDPIWRNKIMRQILAQPESKFE